jgi:phytoene dehydrogenase-like protein
MRNNSEEPVFPFISQVARGSQDDREFAGLTKREYFAGLFLQGHIAHRGISVPEANISNKNTVKMALDLADELLKQL